MSCPCLETLLVERPNRAHQRPEDIGWIDMCQLFVVRSLVIYLWWCFICSWCISCFCKSLCYCFPVPTCSCYSWSHNLWNHEMLQTSLQTSKHPSMLQTSKPWYPSTHPNIHPSISMHRSIQTSKQSSQFTNSTPQPMCQRNEASLKGAPRRIRILNSPKPFKIMRLLKGISRSYAAVFLLVFLCPFSHKATQAHWQWHKPHTRTRRPAEFKRGMHQTNNDILWFGNERRVITYLLVLMHANTRNKFRNQCEQKYCCGMENRCIGKRKVDTRLNLVQCEFLSR